ncbi:MAG: hypothetical protein AAGD25_29265 [Cyanobacteria bacterium P01_F01_bin.150]
MTFSLLVQNFGPFVAFYLSVATFENYVTSGGDRLCLKLGRSASRQDGSDSEGRGGNLKHRLVR